MAVRLVFNSDGFRQYLNSDSVKELVESHTNTIAANASAQVPDSEGFRARTIKSGTRWIGIVGTTDTASEAAEAENKVLSKAVIPNG